MIDRFQRFALAVQSLQTPSAIVSFVCIIAIGVAVLGGESTDGTGYLLPSFAGFIWAAATYSFIATFREIPAKADSSDRFLVRMRQRLRRAWYWLVALMFLGTSALVLILTGRFVSIWLRSRGN